MPSQMQSSHRAWKNDLALVSHGQTISTTVELNFSMYALPRVLGAGTLVVISICISKTVCTLCGHCNYAPKSPAPSTNRITMFNNNMTLNLVSVLWKTQMVMIASCRTLSLTSRTIQHKACSQVGVLFVCLFGEGFSWFGGFFCCFRLLLFFCGFFVVFGFFLHRQDQTQYQSVSDSLRTLRLLTFSLFRIQQNTYLGNSCTHRTFLPSIPCIPSGPRAWTCYCLVEKLSELA